MNQKAEIQDVGSKVTEAPPCAKGQSRTLKRTEHLFPEQRYVELSVI